MRVNLETSGLTCETSYEFSDVSMLSLEQLDQDQMKYEMKCIICFLEVKASRLSNLSGALASLLQ